MGSTENNINHSLVEYDLHIHSTISDGTSTPHPRGDAHAPRPSSGRSASGGRDAPHRRRRWRARARPG